MSNPDEEKRYQELARKWLDKTITPAEQEEFAAWYNLNQDKPIDIPEGFAASDEELRERILYKIKRSAYSKNKKFIIALKWLPAAAAVLLITVIGLQLYIHQSHRFRQHVLTFRKHSSHTDIKPGSNKAILTLANGKTINLTDVKNGVLASQGRATLKKDKDGRIVYEPTADRTDSSTILNTVTVPKGGQYQIVLSDGSKVWLNAASSITFPTTFSKSERKVSITGEVYFEVAKNKHLPFRVLAGKQTVEVLGTHFNINSYADEPSINTTLIEGSVKISADGQSALLKPQQQSSVFNNHSAAIEIKTVDVDNVLAWKNGSFEFEKAEIPLIMRQASRWYDVDIQYDGSIPKRRFTGSISRNVNLSELLNILKYTGINFKIQGKTILVGPEN